jgi:single-stranded-DNA-specific exonuclease
VSPLAGGKHIRLKLRKDDCDFWAVWFGISPEDLMFRPGDKVDIAVNVDVNVYNNTESVSIIIRDMRKSGINEENIIKQLDMLGCLYSGTIDSDSAKLICPERNDLALVFRYIQSHRNVNAGLLENDLSDSLPIGKICIAIDALTELGIIKLDNGRFDLTGFSGKADLESAGALRRLNNVKRG